MDLEAEILREAHFSVRAAKNAVEAEQVFKHMLDIGCTDPKCKMVAVINSRIDSGDGGEELGYVSGYDNEESPDPINGPKLMARLLAIKPDLRILCITSTTSLSTVLTALQEERPDLSQIVVAHLPRPFYGQILISSVEGLMD